MKSKFFAVIIGLSLLSFAIGGCTRSQEQPLTATPLEVPEEGSPGEYITVIIVVSSTQPCKLILSTPHKTGIDNYLAPYTSTSLTVPNSDGKVVLHEEIPLGTTPGNYVLKVMQMKNDCDREGTEIFSRNFIVR